MNFCEVIKKNNAFQKNLVQRNLEQPEIPESEIYRLFKKAAEVGIGIELNTSALDFKTEEEAAIAIKPYKIAKQCGCKFYCGSDAHHPEVLDRAKEVIEKIINLLELTEDDKFNMAK